MEQEKTVKQEIIILDEGITTDSVHGPEPDWACCWVLIMPLRG
jgi:hypothetical protein